MPMHPGRCESQYSIYYNCYRWLHVYSWQPIRGNQFMAITLSDEGPHRHEKTQSSEPPVDQDTFHKHIYYLLDQDALQLARLMLDVSLPSTCGLERVKTAPAPAHLTQPIYIPA